MANALVEVEKNVQTGWITLVSAVAEDYTALISWIKSKESQKGTYKALTYQCSNSNTKHIVNFTNAKVTFNDNRGETTGDKYLPTLVGILAYCGGNTGLALTLSVLT